mmetsp:Transcript_9931/g.11504  ORF Transcript_9931/g.11504 Transcript_9931/m.11504 type:complete len:314 (-) Transcript_9931:377-1318(-)|eukprot:CAMPEP_0197853816 /NCGR_PEP_ID=MMETSP1438-20131217/23484_1 /TAXON_ID=1461541 /ORGANISM="Pterosperma sp., Strain CCMP1384" /LENGTH=313 /DNA_ID=CAMNT_0043468351 /DNA_START=125 /DNA_END=1066 /DNA_ORIENTATION=-
MSYVPPSLPDEQETENLFRPLLAQETPGTGSVSAPVEPSAEADSVASLADVALGSSVAAAGGPNATSGAPPAAHQPQAQSPAPQAGGSAFAAAAAAAQAPSDLAVRAAQAPPAAYGTPAAPLPATGYPMPAHPVPAQPLPPQNSQLPEALAHWKKSHGLLYLWMNASIFYVIIGLVIYLPGLIMGAAGVVGAAIHLCSCCKGSNWASPIKTTYIIATSLVVVESLLSMLLAINLCIGCNTILEGIEEEEDLVLEEEEREYNLSNDEKCTIIMVAISIILIYNCIHLCISVAVSKKAHEARQLLNPISSGVISL